MAGTNKDHASGPAAPSGHAFSLGDLDLPAFGGTDASQQASEQGDETVYLDVFFGERPTGLIGHFRLRDGRLYSTSDELRALGLVVAPGIATDAEGLLPLDALPGLQYRYRPTQQQLMLTVPTTLRPVQILGYTTPGPAQANRNTALVLNYDAYATTVGADDTLSVATALRWMGRAGTLEATGISRAGSQSDAYQRLDTRWSYSDPVRLLTWTAGDVISGAVSWSRAVRLGGVQLRRNFEVRPDLITFPVPRFAGSAAVPSAVELLVNNIQQFNTQVDDGPFVLDTFPRISGAGEATLIVRDALGRTTQTTVPIYVDYLRLAPGLTDFSVEAGVLRRGFGGGIDDYDDQPVVSASWRRGLTDEFTLEAHTELDRDLRLAGIGGVWAPFGQWGVVSASLAHSSGVPARQPLTGNQRTLGYQFNGRRLGIDLQAQRVSSGFRDLASLGDTPDAFFNNVRAQDRASIYAPIPRGSVAYTWVRVLQDDGTRDRIQTLSWSRTFGDRLALNASVFDSETSGTGAGLSLNIALGSKRDASVSVDRSDGDTQAVVALRQNTDYNGGWGWEVEAGNRQRGYGQAQVNVRGRYGDATLGVQHFSSQTAAFFQGSGGLVVMDGQTFVARRINDAFAVVNTNGVADLPVLYENRLYGHTNTHGYLLLPDLRGWQQNRIAIDPDGLGANYRVPDLEQFVTPADDGAVLVNFELSRLHPAMVALLDPQGAPVAAGSQGSILGSAQGFIVGFDGEAYLENPGTDTVLELDLGTTRCRYRVPPQTASAAGTTRLGPLPCMSTTLPKEQP